MASFLSYLFGGSTDKNAANKTIGENGAPLLANAEHPGVSAFNKLVRDHTMAKYNKTGKEFKPNAGELMPGQREILETTESRELVAKYIKDMVDSGEQNIIHEKNYELLADTFLLCAHKRGVSRVAAGGDKKVNICGGEGERLIYYQMVLELYKYYPETTAKLIAMTPEFGYWLDLYQIWALLCWRLENSYTTLRGDGYDYTQLIIAIIDMIYTQLNEDIYGAESDSESDSYRPSALVKWFAREGSYYDKHCYLPGTHPRLTSTTIFAWLFGYYFFDAHARDIGDYINLVLFDIPAPTTLVINKYRRLLRKKVAELNRMAGTVETFTCGRNWAAIDPKKIPSRCMLKGNKAFLNEKSSGRVEPKFEETGNRYPDNPDRVQARKNLLDMLVEPSKIKTAGIDPHEILKNYVAVGSTAQSKIASIQWTQKVAEVMTQINEFRTQLIAEGKEVPAHMGNLIPMMDISGSMSGLPMDVSIGLGLFLTYIQEAQGQEPVAICFSNQPYVYNFKGMSLMERYRNVGSGNGLNTNIELAMDLVLDCIAKSGEHRDLIIFTDGQFDTMNSCRDSWTTSHERILQKVAERGLARAPRIIYWNLRANTPGVQTSAKHPGVQMLQGYSPALLRFVLLGDSVQETEVEVLNTITGEINKVKVSNTTPYDTYRKALDYERWDPIRQMLSESNEKQLAGYCWTKF